MRYERILNAFFGTPLAMLPAKIAAVRAFLLAKAAGEDIEANQVREVIDARRDPTLADRFRAFGDDDPEAVDKIPLPLAGAVRRTDGAIQIGRVAVMTCFGVLSQRVDMLGEASGGVSCEKLGATLDGLVADRSVKAILMAFDSPGGSVFGIQELGAKILAARDQKKIVGLADSMAASAAYWLISQTSEVNVTPGGLVGSIGVYTAHQDVSKADEMDGVKTTLISAGQYKVEGNPYEPLDDEARAAIQKQVDQYYNAFIGAVAKGRGVSEKKVRDNYGQGRVLTSGDALAAGMVDRVATLQQTLNRMGAYDPAEAKSGKPIGASTAAARARAVEVDD